MPLRRSARSTSSTTGKRPPRARSPCHHSCIVEPAGPFLIHFPNHRPRRSSDLGPLREPWQHRSSRSPNSRDVLAEFEARRGEFDQQPHVRALLSPVPSASRHRGIRRSRRRRPARVQCPRGTRATGQPRPCRPPKDAPGDGRPAPFARHLHQGRTLHARRRPSASPTGSSDRPARWRVSGRGLRVPAGEVPPGVARPGGPVRRGDDRRRQGGAGLEQSPPGRRRPLSPRSLPPTTGRQSRRGAGSSPGTRAARPPTRTWCSPPSRARSTSPPTPRTCSPRRCGEPEEPVSRRLPLAARRLRLAAVALRARARLRPEHLQRRWCSTSSAIRTGPTRSCSPRTTTSTSLIGVTENPELFPARPTGAGQLGASCCLGFGLEDWDVRILLRSLVSQEGAHKLAKYTHVAAQIDLPTACSSPAGPAYLEKYFAKFRQPSIDIFWGSVDEFAAGLAELWRRSPMSNHRADRSPMIAATRTSVPARSARRGALRARPGDRRPARPPDRRAHRAALLAVGRRQDVAPGGRAAAELGPTGSACCRRSGSATRRAGPRPVRTATS